MLTKIILEGPMGKEFGREWNLSIQTPNEALRMIDANKPGVFRWIRSNLARFERYQIICEYENGIVESLTDSDYREHRQAKCIRFIPMTAGAGGNGAVQAVLGIVLIVVGAVIDWYTGGTGGNTFIYMGVAMLAGGIAQMLSKQPGPKDIKEADTGNSSTSPSYYFDGPVNTTAQGDPVQLVYGRVLVGSHTISAAATVDQLM